MPESKQHQENVSSNQLLIATAGHVDHGKTSLIKHLTGTETDTLAEERSRGLSINPGYAYHHFVDEEFPQQQLTLGFVDVPGHADFIPNMLAGVGSVAQALLVVAADDGVMPQTREHLAILKLLGIVRITVAITKIDRASSEAVETLRNDVSNLLQSEEFKEDGIFLINNSDGSGTQALLNHLEKSAVLALNDSIADTSRLNRFLIDRSFSVKGIGTVVTGTLRHGRLNANSDLVLSTTGEEVRIRGMRLDHKSLTELEPGQRAALNINVPHDQVGRGDWLLSPASFAPSLRIDVQLTLLDSANPIKSGTQYHLYLGASHHVVNLRRLDEANKLFQVRGQEPIHAHHGDRFVIRDPAAQTTIGGGIVIDIAVPRRGRSSEERLRELVMKLSPANEAINHLAENALLGIDIDAFSVNYDLSTEGLKTLLQQVQSPTELLKTQSSDRGILFSQMHLQKLNAQVTDALKKFHAQHKSAEGASTEQICQTMNFLGNLELLDAVLERLVQANELKLLGTLYSLSSHRASKSTEEQRFLKEIRPLLAEGGNIPPRTRELVEATGIPLKALERILKECAKSKIVIQVADNRYYLPETMSELASFTEELANQNASAEGFTVIQFRDASGIGRNLCIEILEYFDRIGFTRRVDNKRFLNTSKAEKFG